MPPGQLFGDGWDLDDPAGMPGDLDLAVDVDAHQKAEAEHDAEHGRPPIGDQRHGDAHDRDQAHHHRAVDEDIEEEVEHQAHGDEAGELAARGHGDLDA